MSFPSWMCVYLHATSIDGIEGSPSHNKRLDVCTTFKEKESKNFLKPEEDIFQLKIMQCSLKTLGGYFT